MTEQLEARFKAKLETRRQEVVREIQFQTGELAIGEGDHDPIDQVQSMVRRDQAANTLGRLSRTLSDVEAALRAIAEGCYGDCVECGEPISAKRLEIIPWASHCIRCQELVEKRDSLLSGPMFGTGREAA